MSTSPVLDIFSVNIAHIESNSLSIPILIKCAEENKTVEILGLIDSGAGGKFIDQNYAKTLGLETKLLNKPITARNVDGTENKQGKITNYVDLDLTINGRTVKTQLLISGLGKQKIILGFPWLNENNPDIDWKTGRFNWRSRHPALERILQKHRGKPASLLKAKALARLSMETEQMSPKLTITDEPDQEEKFN